jgi:hypothetical protein
MSEEIQVPRHEEPQKTKEELFQENPDRFEDLKNCLMVVKRDTDTNKIMILNQCKDIEEGFIVEGYIKDAMAAFRGALRMKQAQEGIVKANGKHNILDFARRIKK